MFSTAPCARRRNGGRKTAVGHQEPNLLRNTSSGRYNGRFTPTGKQKWVDHMRPISARSQRSGSRRGTGRGAKAHNPPPFFGLPVVSEEHCKFQGNRSARTDKPLLFKGPSAHRIEAAEKAVLLAVGPRCEIQGIGIAQAVAISERDGPDAIDGNDL
jgi:hypothetical protein